MKLVTTVALLVVFASAAHGDPKHNAARGVQPQVVVTFDTHNGTIEFESGPPLEPKQNWMSRNLAAYFAAGYSIVALAQPTGRDDRTIASLAKTGKSGAYVEFNPWNGEVTTAVGKDKNNGESIGDWLANGWVVRAIVNTGAKDSMAAALDK
jgi:hypothetical protein